MLDVSKAFDRVKIVYYLLLNIDNNSAVKLTIAYLF